MVRYLAPQRSMYPRGKIVPAYGFQLYESRIVEHTVPGQWEFTYTNNHLGYRGPAIPISNRYMKDNIVVLGDSNSYGMGVNDGEEYSAVMNELLDDSRQVINLGVWGYGLTQQIRRFYEFGVLYQPSIVVLQFAGNDITDNLLYDVTKVEDGRFVFQDANFGTSWIKSFLSDSIIQKSQLYNLVKGNAFTVWRAYVLGKINESDPAAESEVRTAPSKGEAYYIELLNSFVDDLNRQDIHVVMFSVNNNLDKYPFVEAAIMELDAGSQLQFVDVLPWFDGVEDYGSLEGHSWGKKGHRIVGENLTSSILTASPVSAKR